MDFLEVGAIRRAWDRADRIILRKGFLGDDGIVGYQEDERRLTVLVRCSDIGNGTPVRNPFLDEVVRIVILLV